jgi:hypothetical protein
LYRIRKLLLTGTERLDGVGRDRLLLGLRVGDPQDEVLGARLAKDSVRDVYLADNWREARTLLDKPSPDASPIRCPRSCRPVGRCDRGEPRSWPITPPVLVCA